MNVSRTQNSSLASGKFITALREHWGAMFGIILVGGLIFFEMFNFSTTEFALRDLLGELKFAGILWSTTLSIAFCAIDFAGIARLFSPDEDEDWKQHKPVWYLFGAWMLAAMMNAILTWWGVSMAIVNHSVASSNIVDSNTILLVVPVFVSMMVFVIRILLIGSLSTTSNRLLWGTPKRSITRNFVRSTPTSAPVSQMGTTTATAHAARTNLRPASAMMETRSSHSEPTYHNNF